MSESIFRKEALAHQNARLPGDVIISQPVSLLALTALLAVATFVAFIYLATNEYTRRENVAGFLVPSKGVVAVFAPQSGLLSELYAFEGDFIEQGSDLFKIQIDQQVSSENYISFAVLRELGAQKARLTHGIQLAKDSLAAQLERQDNNISKLTLEISSLHEQIETQTELNRIESNALVRARDLMTTGAIAKSDADSVEKNFLDKQQQLQNLQLHLSNKTFELEEAKIIRNTYLIESRKEVAELENRVSEITRHIATAEAEQSNIIRAPVSGTITASTPNLGQLVAANVPVVTIIPAGSQLEAHLYVPTRAIGFIHEGQKVNLRYEAFPYQRFGLFRGSIRQVTNSVLSPNEVPALLPVKEPVYRITATLANQSVVAYGHELPLKPGMLFSADIELNKRSLFEWLLAPLYSLKGKL